MRHGSTIVLLALLAFLASDALGASSTPNPDPAVQQWIRSLADKKGNNCCDFADGSRVEDPDWEFDGSAYRVRLAGEWYQVPDYAVLAAGNKIGYAIVWRYIDRTGLHIRCFLPGPEI